MVRETDLSPADFIYPLFVVEGRGVRKPIAAMPGVFNFSVDEVAKEAKEVEKLGIPSVILFGIPDHKDAKGTQAYAEQGVVQKAIREIKTAVPNLEVIADICLCEYTDHGHCGVVTKTTADKFEIDNDETLPLLAQMAVSCAQAGASVVAPSDMMDGRIAAVRKALDEVGLTNVVVLSYAAKYASGFYGPFREAAQSTPQFGDRRSYQMDPGNAREALREVKLDIEEGADIVMVKPALAYLDVIRRVREAVDVPVGAYNVSGEYSMVKAAAANGWIDYERVMMEILTGIKRAGADIILTYHAVEAAKLIG
jgi:porphobilinogen synthase